MPEPAAPVARLLEERRALDRAYSSGHHGRWSASRRAGLTDTCLRALFAEAASAGGVALVALGGYGRGELLPGSDIDLLILHAEVDQAATRELAERMLYPLWDAGLPVGHAVRTIDEGVELAGERLDVATAMLDGRLVAGEEPLWRSAHDAVRSLVGADTERFAERLREDAEVRRERFGAVSFLLEPELKEGAGGSRDVHVLGWLRASLGRPLEDAALLRVAERDAIDTAAEFLVRARSALHLQTGRRTERLLLEQQPAVAAAMGFADEPGLASVDGLMRQVFEHARHVEQVRASVLDRVLGGTPSALAVTPTPEGILRAFGHVARGHDAMPPAALDDVARASLPTTVEWTPEVREAFLDLVRAGDVEAFATLDRLGLLERFVPAWADVHARPQRDPYHRFPVDVHLLETLAGVRRLLDEPGEDPVAAWAAELVDDPDGLLLGAWLHDIGKTGGGDHVPNGTGIAAATLERMGVTAGTRDLARFLVAEHLLLSDTATRRDLEDDDLIHDVAGSVGDPARLACLYLLTVADAAATGPLAWTPWRAALVRELVGKVRRVLERGEVGADTAERESAAKAAIAATLVREDPAAVRTFLQRMPRGYLLSVPTERAGREFGLLTSPVGPHDVRTLETPGARPGTHELTVVVADRPGLLAQIAGALTLANLSILTAQVFTTEDGVALDRFEVTGAFEAEIGSERWRAFRSTLRRALEGRLSLDHDVRQKRRHYPSPRTDVPIRVAVDNEASDFFTVVEVGAPDRIGLLFDITRTFADLRLDVHLAKVATYGVRVVDAFYVRDDLGRKLEDDRVPDLERALLAHLST